jgi:hypothetical protein
MKNLNPVTTKKIFKWDELSPAHRKYLDVYTLGISTRGHSKRIEQGQLG